MSDLLQETRVSLTQLAHQEGVSIPTTRRWAMRGIKGIRLETIQIGGRRFTSLESYARAVERWTAAANGDSVTSTSRTNRQHQAAIARDEAELAADGI